MLNAFVTLSCFDVETVFSSEIKIVHFLSQKAKGIKTITKNYDVKISSCSSMLIQAAFFFLSQREVTETIAFYITENSHQKGGKHGVPKNYLSTWSVVQVTQPQIFFQHCHESITPLKTVKSEKMDFADDLC